MKGILVAAALGLAAFGGWWLASGRNGTNVIHVPSFPSGPSVPSNHSADPARPAPAPARPAAVPAAKPTAVPAAKPTAVPAAKPAAIPAAKPAAIPAPAPARYAPAPAAKFAVPARPSHVIIAASHKGVQLWEGGPYWATTNIGAEKPEDYGYYFWWGDTKGYKREGNAWVVSDGSHSDFSFGKDTSSTYGKSIEALRNEGWITADGILAPEHDAAHVQWGCEWRMPTKQELDDLVRKCDWKWTTLNGVKGYEVRGNGVYASARIFLPCAGGGTSLNNSGSYGGYWSSVPDSGSSGYSWSLYFDSSYRYTCNYYRYGSRRYYGFSVRPVQGFTK